MSDPDPSMETADRPPVPRGWFFQRYWEGRIGLGNAYWLVFVPFLLAVIFGAIPYSEDLVTLEPTEGFIKACYVWTVIALGGAWVCTGLYRAALRHEAQGGRYGPAESVKFSSVLGGVYLLGVVLSVGVPQFGDHIKYLQWDEDIGPTEFRLINEVEIELTGSIDYGAAKTLEEYLSAHPGIRTVHLSSEGGWIRAGRTLRDVIVAHKLDTVTMSECSSACVIAFAGGAKRYLHEEDGMLGFHASAGLDPDDFTSDDVLIDELSDRGIDREFLKRAYSVPNEDIWYPDDAELKTVGFVTDFTDYQFAMSGFGAVPDEETVGSWLTGFTYYEVLKEVRPDFYGPFLTGLIARITLGLSENDIVTWMNEALGAEIEKAVRYAPDSVLVDLLKEEKALMEKAARDAPDLCGRLMERDPVDPYLPDVASPEGGVLDVRPAFRTLFGAPVMGTPMDVSQREYDTVIAKLMTASAKQDDDAGQDSEISSDKWCAGALLLYDSILELPEAEAARMVRGRKFSIADELSEDQPEEAAED